MSAREAVLEQVVEWRRHLHRHPELSFHERETAAFVAETLAGFDGLDIERPAENSVVARLRTGRPGRTVALRADIDALPIDEQSGVDYASENPGVMHACGHDGHTAMLLGAARVLAGARDDLPGGEVRFLFQPAEEIAPGGARDLVAAGAVDGVDFVYGCHLWTPLELGKVAAMPGPFMAASDFFTLAITGRGGHGGLPHLADDPIAIAAQVLANLQHVVARRTAAHGAEYELDYQFGYQPVVNDERATALVREAIDPEMRPDLAPIMGGDDFSAYLARVPGCYAFIGAGDEGSGAVFPHHHPRFRIDERALETGVRLHVEVALRALKEEA